MDKWPIDKNKYPLRVLARRIHLFVRRECPCIVYFKVSQDMDSLRIDYNVKEISHMYPKIFCYRVEWYSHLTYFQTITPSDKYDVTVWKSGQKIMIISKPDVKHLQIMFEYVHNEIMGPCRDHYLSTFYKKRCYNKRKYEITQCELQTSKQIRPQTEFFEDKFKNQSCKELKSQISPTKTNKYNIFKINDNQKLTCTNTNTKFVGQNNSYLFQSKTNNVSLHSHPLNNISFSQKEVLGLHTKPENKSNTEEKRLIPSFLKPVPVSHSFFDNTCMLNSQSNYNIPLKQGETQILKDEEIAYKNAHSQSMFNDLNKIDPKNTLTTNNIVQTVKTGSSRRKPSIPTKFKYYLSEKSYAQN